MSTRRQHFSCPILLPWAVWSLGKVSFQCVNYSGMEKTMATHSSTLAWGVPWTEDPGRRQSMGWLRVRYDWATSLWRIGEGNGSPLPYSCGAWWAAVYGVAQSRTQLKRLSSSSSSVWANPQRLVSHYFFPLKLHTSPPDPSIPGPEHLVRCLGGCALKKEAWIGVPSTN